MFYSNRHAASPHTIISHHATAVMHAMLSTMGDAPRTTQKARCWQRMPKALPPPPGARKPTVQLTLCNYNVRRQTPVTLFRHMSQVPSAKHNLSAHSVCHWHSCCTTRKTVPYRATASNPKQVLTAIGLPGNRPTSAVSRQRTRCATGTAGAQHETVPYRATASELTSPDCCYASATLGEPVAAGKLNCPASRNTPNPVLATPLPGACQPTVHLHLCSSHHDRR